MDIELRQLHYFVVVAEELHFARAAQRLHMAQQPLSVHIRQLETELKVKLFHRTTRKVELTAAGSVFLEQARQIRAQTQQAVVLAQRTARGEVGQLVIGYANTVLYNVLPRTIRTFRERFPEVAIRLRELCGADLQTGLLTGDIDVGFFETPARDPGLCVELLMEQPVLVALPVGHPLAHQSHIPLRSLAQEPFIQYTSDKEPFVHDQIVALCHAAGFSPTVVQDAMNEQAAIGLVAAGIGIGLVSASLQEFRLNDVVYRPLSEPGVTVEFSIAWRRGDVSPTVQAVIELARQVAHEAEHPSVPA